VSDGQQCDAGDIGAEGARAERHELKAMCAEQLELLWLFPPTLRAHGKHHTLPTAHTCGRDDVT